MDGIVHKYRTWAARKRVTLFHDERYMVDWGIPLITYWSRVTSPLKTRWFESFKRQRRPR